MAGVRSIGQVCGIQTLLPGPVLVWLISATCPSWTRGYRLSPMHRVSAVPAKKGVPSRLAVDEAAAAPLRDGPRPTVIPLNKATIVGGTGVVDEVAGRCGHRMCLSDLGAVLMHGVTAGLEGPEGNLGNRERFKVS